MSVLKKVTLKDYGIELKGIKERKRDGVIIITPKKAFIDWANSFCKNEEDKSSDEFYKSCKTAFLTPTIDSKEQVLKMFEYYYHEDIFNYLLVPITLNRKDWPKKRDFKTFLEWFDVEFADTVLSTDWEVLPEFIFCD